MLIAETYGLWPAFLNGMLDSVPASMVLVDGNENYYIEGAAYYTVANKMRNLTGPALARSHRRTGRSTGQMQVGFGFYLDMYINPEGNQYYGGPRRAGRGWTGCGITWRRPWMRRISTCGCTASNAAGGRRSSFPAGAGSG